MAAYLAMSRDDMEAPAVAPSCNRSATWACIPARTWIFHRAATGPSRDLHHVLVAQLEHVRGERFTEAVSRSGL